MPIWLALFWSVRNILAVTPEELLSLSRYLYPWPIVYSAVPLSNSFLWLNLAVGDMILAILVGGTMWVQQKMMMSSSADPKQQAQSQMMLWMMPLMFAFLTMSLPSGLALYWLTSNVITIGMQYFVTGWGGLVKSTATKPSGRDKKYKRRITQVEQASPADADIGADIVEPDSGQKSSGYPTQSRSISIRRQPKKGKGRRHKGK
jgi:YidC/Oxa1 family membrane protein insertase